MKMMESNRLLCVQNYNLPLTIGHILWTHSTIFISGSICILFQFLNLITILTSCISSFNISYEMWLNCDSNWRAPWSIIMKPAFHIIARLAIHFVERKLFCPLWVRHLAPMWLTVWTLTWKNSSSKTKSRYNLTFECFCYSTQDGMDSLFFLLQLFVSYTGVFPLAVCSLPLPNAPSPPSSSPPVLWTSLRSWTLQQKTWAPNDAALS